MAAARQPRSRTDLTPSQTVLAACLIESGYTRKPDESRRGTPAYKKGWEVRLVLKDHDEADFIKDCLIQAGMRPGKRFTKHGMIVQPVYGRSAVEAFLGWEKRLATAPAA
ncbi:MAG: hypothetical protein FJW39_32470 [Acidobacteria bacterium]|nr:hypothetical protein [Acidobacteriota bacterium]